jgi:multidrug resistance efflux pump
VTTTGPSSTSGRQDPPSPESEASFRERALSGAPNPLERIDHLFHHTSRRIWLGVVGLAILLAAGVLWTAVAKQTITADAPAVIVPPSGVYTVGSPVGGAVSSLLVREGGAVRSGQPLALIRPGGSASAVGVRSPVSGRVLAVETRVGDASAPGTPMFVIVPLHMRAMAIALFPESSVAQLAVGQQVAVTVSGVSPERYGKAIGRVVAIEEVPVSEQRLKQLTGDFSLATFSRQAGGVREVRIRLTPAHTPSGLAWEGGRGPAGPLPVDSRALAAVTVSQQTLLSKAFG